MDIKLKETLRPLGTNKYVITVVIFLVWLIFFDANSLVMRFKLSRQVKRMETEKVRLQEAIEQTERKMDELKSDKEQLEKFAREEYLMKREDEVIFIIKEK